MFSTEQGIVLIGMFLAVLAIVVLFLRYSNKKHTERLIEIKEKLGKIEKTIKFCENEIGKKKNLLKKIQSLERELQKSIK